MLKLEIKNINTDLNELKKFGKTVGAVFSAIGLFLFLYHKMQFGFYIGGLGILLVLLGFIFPRSLKNPYKIWMTLALVMGFFMSRLILTILFYFVVTPIGLLAKMFRKDFGTQFVKTGPKEDNMLVQMYNDTIGEINTLEEFGNKVTPLIEKNVPTQPSKWAYYKAQAKKKFDVYPSAYANGWAARKYKAAGGGWKKG